MSKWDREAQSVMPMQNANGTLKESYSWLNGEAYRQTRVKRRVDGIELVRTNEKTLCEAQSRLAKRFSEYSKNASPRTCLYEYVDIGNERVKQLVDGSLINRFSWVMAATATGGEESVKVATEGYLILGEWWHTRRLLAEYRRGVCDLSEWISNAEFLHRSTFHNIRYSWINQQICQTLASELEESAEGCLTVPPFTVDQVDDLLEAARKYALDGRLDLSTGAFRLARSCSIKAGSLSKSALEDLMISREIQEKPWVRFDDHTLYPVALQEVNYSFDQTLLQLLSSCPGISNQIKGKIFEQVAEKCLSKALRLRVTTKSRPFGVKIDQGNPGEIDGCLGAEPTLIMECKSNFLTRNTSDVGNAFTDNISKAVKQVRLRVHALSELKRPIVDSDKQEYFASEDLLGICVVAHPYAGAFLKPEFFSLLPSKPSSKYPVLVADLHTWILTLNAMDNTKELRKYFEYRGVKQEDGFIALDDCDLLVHFFYKRKKGGVSRTQLHSLTNPDTVMVIGGLAVKSYDALTTQAPRSASSWWHTLDQQTH